MRGQSFFSVIRSFLSLLLSLCLLLSFFGCREADGEKGKGKNSKAKTVAATEVVLPYSKEDGLNPFVSGSLMNSVIMPLLYEGLFYADGSFAPVEALASGYELRGNLLTVSLSQKRFSDGSVISADDVVYSFNKAKASTLYSSSLINISSCRAGNRKSVIFDFVTPTIYGACDLVFPVVKQNTAETRESIAVGAGPFRYRETASGGVLEGTAGGRGRSISLYNISSDEALFYALAVGNYTAAYNSLASGKTERINASSVFVPLNNMLYIGINKDGPFQDVQLKRSLCAALNRKELISSGFEGNACECSFPFNPLWYAAKDKKIQGKGDAVSAKKLAGLLKGKRIGILVNSENSFKLKTAKLLSKQLSAHRVYAFVNALPPEEYKAALEAGDYDLYIGEMLLTNDMDISPLLKDSEFINVYNSFAAGEIKTEEYLRLFYEQQPFIVLGFRYGVLAYSRDLKTVPEPLPGNPYANAAEWSY